MSGHEQSQQQDRDEAQGHKPDPQEVARAVAPGEDDGTQQDTPPGGDVRTVYANDRNPGDAEPSAPQ
jgi:hypothetical protein